MEIEEIKKIFHNLEITNDIKILYAVEAGSRTWGLESKDSDYDMRFIYKHNDIRKYLQLQKIPKTIDGFSDDRIYDWQGWDIQKSLMALHELNPSIIEWLNSPIVYFDDQTNKDGFILNARKLLAEHTNYLPLLYHYRSMAKSNYNIHIKDKQEVNVKKYLYVIRPAGMVQWLISKLLINQDEAKDFNNSLVQIDFNIVLIEIKDQLTDECFDTIQKMIIAKKTMNEGDLQIRIKCIDEWIEKILNETDSTFKTIEKNNSKSKQSLSEYDELLFKVLGV
jgi:uncharacterized protein